MRTYATLRTMTITEAPRTPVIPEWTFADRLRKVRQIVGLDQRGMAGALGVSPATLGHWELGTNTPRNLIAVARQLETLSGVPAAWLLGVSGSNVNFGWSKRLANPPRGKLGASQVKVA